MIDPFTALSVASAAVSQMRTLITNGRDASAAMSKFAGAWSDINFAENKAANPPWYKSFSQSVEKEALEIYTAKRKMAEMKKEVETMIQFIHGPTGLAEYKDTIRAVRDERRKHEYKKEEIKQAIIDWTVGILCFLVVVGLIGVAIWFVGGSQGKW